MLGILDWGIGGFGLYRELRDRGFRSEVLYLSDAGYAPYGTLGSKELTDRVTRCCRALQDRGATEIVIACNAASTVIESVQSRLEVPVAGMISSGVETVLAAEGGSVGVIGGIRTIRSGVYRRKLVARGYRVTGRIAQPLSALIERGEIDTVEFREALEEIVRPLRRVELLLLACTHYAAAIDHFRTEMPETTILDPVPHLAAKLIGPCRAKRDEEFGSVIAMSTGCVTQMKEGVRMAFGVGLEGEGCRVESLSLQV